MKRWQLTDMLNIGRKLFAKIYKRKHLANPNHDVHILARDIDNWLVNGVESLIKGGYTPRPLKRLYFTDERVDQLHLTDRVLQNILLKQLKPTFSHVMNPNCYHLHGPNGVKLATQKVKEALQKQKLKYIIRADIKSFYKSIPHQKLIEDLKGHYNDKKVQWMLQEIIINPIETPRGYRNPDYGIALRGPLSQFFSGIYLKPLDDAFDNMAVTYLRFQDDILILCQSKRQLQRCKQRMMCVLKERQLKLSRRKTRMGCIEQGFHFLGIYYPGTQSLDYTNKAQANKQADISVITAGYQSSEGRPCLNKSLSDAIVPHPRTLRKARENVKQMVADGVSRPKIRSYLFRWACWWATTSRTWRKNELLAWFIQTCWDQGALQIALGLDQHYFKELRTRSIGQQPGPGA